MNNMIKHKIGVDVGFLSLSFAVATKLRLLLLAAVVFLAGCALNPATGEHDFVLMSESQELELGRKYHPEVLKAYPLLDNDELQAYVNRVGQRVAKRSDRADIVYRFSVLDSTDVNAFALPGGYIYITRGLLAYLNSEDELAAVLGHETAHVTARHAVRGHALSTATGLLTVVAAAKAGSQDGFRLAGLVNNALVAGYGRQLELEADSFGAQYMANSEYEPKSMLKVLGFLKRQEEFEVERAKLEGRKPRRYHGVFASHPDNDDRLQEVVAAATQLAAQQTATVSPVLANEQASKKYFDVIDGLPFGYSTAEGVHKRLPVANTDSVMSDSAISDQDYAQRKQEQFLHQALEFKFNIPDGWGLQNLPDKLVLTQKDPTRRESLRAQYAIQLTSEEVNKRLSPQDFIRERLKITEFKEGADINNASGLSAWGGIHESGPFFDKSPQWVGTVMTDDRAYIVTTPVNRVEPELIAGAKVVLQSFSKLNAADKKLAEQLTLQIVEVSDGMNYASLAKNSPIPEYAEQILRLLNGDYPDKSLQVGRKIKVVR